jgi:tRNA-dihydrouridine synthase C
VATRHRAGRLKQWLNYMRRVYPEAQQAFDELRLVHDAAHIERWLALHTAPSQDLATAL